MLFQVLGYSYGPYFHGVINLMGKMWMYKHTNKYTMINSGTVMKEKDFSVLSERVSGVMSKWGDVIYILWGGGSGKDCLRL